jgi:O-antigen ligase
MKVIGSRYGFFYIVLYSLFLYPIILNSISINLSFLLFPLLIISVSKSIKIPNIELILIMLLYFTIFFFSAFNDVSNSHFIFRRTASFIYFMSMFSYIFINIKRDDIIYFDSAVIIVSLIFSIKSIFIFLYLNAQDIEIIKNTVGSQRFGFIYIIAFYSLLLGAMDKFFNKYIKYVMIFIIIVGCLFTFSRTVYVSLVFSFIIYLIKLLIFENRYSHFIKYIFIISISFFILYLSIPSVELFVENRIINILGNAGVLEKHLNNKNTSEGFRFFLWSHIIDYVLDRPLTGSGFIGVWNDIGFSGSAHSQYFDVFYRVGFAGFLLYLYIILKLLKQTYWLYPHYFFGLIGILVYGIFHETFKESQGAFVLAFMLGIVQQKRS